MSVCADPLCGHSLADHDHPDGDGCYGAVVVEAGQDQGDNVQPPAHDRCYCPTFRDVLPEAD